MESTRSLVSGKPANYLSLFVLFVLICVPAGLGSWGAVYSQGLARILADYADYTNDSSKARFASWVKSA